MSLTASAEPSPSVLMLRYLDLVLIWVAAPIMLLIGVPALGYLAGAGAWTLLRAAGVGVERLVALTRDPTRTISIRLGYMLGRLFLLALAVILARQSSQDDGLAALVVIVFAFTIYLGISAATRPRTR